MKNVFIKYNPYKLETEITVDGKALAENSVLGEKILPGTRMQEWVEELPQVLIEEYNDNQFNIKFHGTLPDFEDLDEVCAVAELSKDVKLDRERIPAKETFDKEKLIDDVFAKIQQGPFDELRDESIINAFEHAKSGDFEVCVVATMSAGKSTLINSMLAEKLMPSKQEACTAIITRIKDMGDKTQSWQAEVFDQNDNLIEFHKNLTYESMERLNESSEVSLIKASGNIPFVSTENVALVLIDTPGPNNSRDLEHRRVQSEFLNKSSKALILYIMEGTFGSDDDNNLLQKVADSMKVGGKQSKDRFIFVINKMDGRKAEDGSTTEFLGRVASYLNNHGIDKPNLYPAAALPALNIRLIQNGSKVDEDTLEETEMIVRRLNRNESMHFEKYADLPSRVKAEMNTQLFNAESPEERALIHTGVVSVEAAIRQYVHKYAKTAKIKNIVDTFMHKLHEVGCFEQTKKELAENIDKSQRIIELIEKMKRNIDDVESARSFEAEVDSRVSHVHERSKKVIDDIVEKYQSKITQRIDKIRGNELSIADANREAKDLERFAGNLEPDFQADLDELIQQNLISTSKGLLEEYKAKLGSLSDELDCSDLKGVFINPLELMAGTVPILDDFFIESLIEKRKVEVGEEWFANRNRKWYKPWTWFQESGWFETIFETVEYVDASELAQEFLAPIQQIVHDNGDKVRQHALDESNRIAKLFTAEFAHLDAILKDKLVQLEQIATDKKDVEKCIKESEEKLEWLKMIQIEVESILEI